MPPEDDLIYPHSIASWQKPFFPTGAEWSKYLFNPCVTFALKFVVYSKGTYDGLPACMASYIPVRKLIHANTQNQKKPRVTQTVL